jgi:hypothetical protein
MKNSIIALTLIGAVVARPAALRTKREVPQEHAHRNVNLAVNDLLNMNNPNKIQDSVFALLGAKAAAEGAGDIADAGELFGTQNTSFTELITSRLSTACCC